MKLRKFPVAAPDGTEYEALVSRENIAFGVCGLCFKLFEQRTVENWRGKTRIKRREVAAAAYFEADVMDVIEIVRGMVRYVEKRKEDDKKREAAYEAFTHWDGRVAD